MSGIEAIIEDDVTSRFEAEELKNWNLLTRTNRRYEFISWKLTIIWVIGFFIRYLVLMPIRVIICFIGVRTILFLLWGEHFRFKHTDFVVFRLIIRCVGLWPRFQLWPAFRMNASAIG